MKLIYITSALDSAFNSQVCDLLNHHSFNNEIKEIHLLIQAKEQETKCNKIINIKFIKHYPQYNFFNFFNARVFLKALKRIGVDNNTVFHTRGHLSAFYLKLALNKLNLKTINILVDIRGTAIEEFTLFNRLNPTLTKQKIKHFNRAYNCIKTFNFSCVSQTLKEYMVNNYGIDNPKTIIAHSLVSNNFTYSDKFRNEIRSDLGLTKDDICIVFSTGGGSLWQNTDKIIKLFSEIKNVKVLILAKGDFSKYNNVIAKYIDFTDMPKYLSAADIAIIKRDDNIVNHVASPIKFSEYLACGLPVIADNSVKLIAETINNNNVGVVLNSNEKINTDLLNNLLKLDKNKISEIGKSIFGINNIAKNYFNKYNQILNEK